MTLFLRMTLTAVLLTVAHAASAQQPPRPNETPRAVTLSLTEYNRLIDLASRPPQGTAIAPVAAVLSSADLRVRVERDTARGVFTVTGDALRAGVSRVGLLAGATLIDASAGGRPVPLIADGNAHTALIPGPGPFSLALDWGAPLTYRPGRASFVLPVPQAGTARATFDLPGDQADVHLSSGLVTRRSVTAGRTIVEATLDPGSSTEVWWSMRDSAPSAAARELRTLSDVMTLLTLGDSDVRMVALIDVTVVQGELRTVTVRLPAGYELTGISGSSLENSEPAEGSLALTVGNPAARSHQFLISLERPHDGGSFNFNTGFVSVSDVQRERGEVAIEGVGTLELTADEREPMHRIDVRELNQALQSLARLPVLSAFRYQRMPNAAPALALDVKRFADAGVLAAVADRAVATTLVTSEGRALTEIVLTVQNRAQPFLKVTLPPGATMVSVDVGGQPAKPVLGTDGTRVPLLRPGFRPTGAYQVSFVYLHAGIPFAKKGDLEMTLPKMDMPVAIVQWELFAPERYSVKTIGGNAIDVGALDASGFGGVEGGILGGVVGGIVGGAPAAPVYRGGAIRVSFADGLPGQVRGVVKDTSGAVLAGVTIELASGATENGLRSAVSNERGAFSVLNVPPGTVTVTATLIGFRTAGTSFGLDERPRQLEIDMAVGDLTETITVTGETPVVNTQSATRSFDFRNVAPPPATTPRADLPAVQPSQNVVNLQKKTAGVLPVRVDVPRAGASHRFIKPLVVDQETVVKLRYKRR
ncbi:MAG TPA: carboxypeptidase-like regulatory domain-containing protein [Vicinamibacterales bacterium]|nr:carboxypeptidase-like regulatory domain-containing protein [Vicinamibacterales bacterium]